MAQAIIAHSNSYLKDFVGRDLGEAGAGPEWLQSIRGAAAERFAAMGFPTRMFTVLFAIGRLPGWLAHYKEMLHDPATKIARPRQVYTGPVERDFVEIEKR